MNGPTSFLRRAVGTAAGSTLAATVLIGGCVFVAMAGPALSFHTRTQALHQTLAGLSDIARSLQVNASWSNFTIPLSVLRPGRELTAAELADATREIGRDFTALGLRLAPGQWAGLADKPTVVSGAGPHAQAIAPPQLEVAYRDQLPGHARLVAGSYASTAAPAGALAVAATTQTAARYGLRPGSRVSVQIPGGSVSLYVTAIIAERAAGSTFWTEDSTVGTPSLNGVATPHAYWSGGVFADPDQLGAYQDAFSGPGMQMIWEFPLDVSKVDAAGLTALNRAMTRAVSESPPLTGALAASGDTLSVSTPLTSALALFVGTQAAVGTVLLLLFVSLVVTGAAVILLAGLMTAARRQDELAVLRARGGSLWQVAATMARAALISAVPATAAGVALAAVAVPGGTTQAEGWQLAGVTVAAALAGPPLVAMWRHRRTAPAQVTRTGTGWLALRLRRPVAEVAVCAAAVAGLVVLHAQGLPADGGTNLYLTVTPVLVAVPVVLITLRLYPLVVRGLLALSARGRGATGFVALTGAARSSMTGVLPAFALVLALSLATFAGMVTGGIGRGEVAASWHATGADVVIEPPAPVSPGAVAALARVRGVRVATAVWNTNWVTPFGQAITVTSVDPAAYAALTAGTPFPAFPARTIRAGKVPVPVLASPAAAVLIGQKPTQLFSFYAMGPVPIQVAGTLSASPVQPAGGAWVIMPLETLPGQAGTPAPNLVLVTGSAIDEAQLTAVAGQWIPGGLITFRSQVLASLASSPLQHGAGFVIVFTYAAAAAFGLFIVILGLALGAAERELTLARLTVLGHGRATRLVMTEALPALLAAVLAGTACALLLPHVIGSSIDLSAFTGTSAPVEFQPDVPALVLPAAGILLLAAAVLATESRALRRHGVTGTLRAH